MLPVEVVHHLLRLLGAGRGLLVVGVELGLRYLLVEFVKVGFRAFGLRLGLGIVNVKLRLVVVGGHPDIVDGSLDAIGTQPPTVGQGVSGLFAHARGFGLPNDRVTSILQHAVRTLDLAAAETGALALLENLFRSVLGAAGNVLQSLLGLGALLGKSVEQIPALVEHHAIVLAGVGQFTDLLIQLVDRLVCSQIARLQTKQRLDKIIDLA